jgi:hypothetical protein
MTKCALSCNLRIIEKNIYWKLHLSTWFSSMHCCIGEDCFGKCVGGTSLLVLRLHYTLHLYQYWITQRGWHHLTQATMLYFHGNNWHCTPTCRSTAIEREGTVVFPRHQWLGERAMMLRYRVRSLTKLFDTFIHIIKLTLIWHFWHINLLCMSINKLYLDHFHNGIVENSLSPQSPTAVSTFTEKERPRYPASKLTLSLLMSYIYIYTYIYIYGAPSKARNLTYICGRDFLLGILLLEPCTSLIYA